MNENSKNDIINRELTIENSVLLENMQKKNIYIENLEEEKQNLEKEKQNLKEEIKTLQEKLDSIIYSRSYKAIQKVKKIIKRR